MQVLFTLVVGICGGFILSIVNAPLPWTLGPVLAVSLTSLLLKRQLIWPLFLRNIALISLGYSMGRPFTVETGHAILSQLPFMLMATFVTICAGLFSAWLMYRRTKIDLSSCLLGCVPGGLSQMVILAAELKETDLTAVTTAPIIPQHYLYAAQVCVGSYIGSSIDLRKIREYNGMGPVLLGSVLLVLAVSMVMGCVIAFCTPSSITWQRSPGEI